MKNFAILGFVIAVFFQSTETRAVQLDWDGQFWFDQQWLNNYQLDRARPGYDNDSDYTGNGSPYVPGAGEKNAVWYAAHLRLKPKLVVNDNVRINSEWDIGSPVYGFFGRGFPSSGDDRFNFTGSQKDGATITWQRAWASLITDFGTIEIGRAPRHWGLGALWNNGDKLFDRFRDTGDMVRLVSKFGNFSVQPAMIKVAAGNNAAGASDSSGNIITGSDDVTDYELAAKYDNSEEEFEFGVSWTKRVGDASQSALYFNSGKTGTTKVSYNIFDFYSRKKLGRFSFGGELPFMTGDIGSVDGTSTQFRYKTFAIIGESSYTSDMWNVALRFGHAPGQPASSVGDDKFQAMYLNKNYKLGLIMFNYNLYGLSRNNPDSVSSTQNPYDNQLVNATYVALNPELKLDKWKLHSTFVIAFADEVAKSGQRLYNHARRKFYSAVDNQDSFLGWELDLGTSFQWDENCVFAWDLGLFSPGNYYEFANRIGGPRLNSDTMFASQVRVGITF